MKIRMMEMLHDEISLRCISHFDTVNSMTDRRTDRIVVRDTASNSKTSRLYAMCRLV